MRSITPTSALLSTLVFGSDGAAQSPARTERFDMMVRADFFAEFAGDQARLQRAMMEQCERTLAENPRHAEALVWHGGGVMFQAGAAFARGDAPRGAEMWERGLKEMNEPQRSNPTMSA